MCCIIHAYLTRSRGGAPFLKDPYTLVRVFKVMGDVAIDRGELSDGCNLSSQNPASLAVARSDDT